MPGSSPPAPVDPQVLAAFTRDCNQGPDPNNPRFDWKSPFSARWNRLTIYQLATQFRAEVIAGLYPELDFDESIMSVPQLSIFCERKLTRTRAEYLATTPPPGISETPLEDKLRRAERKTAEATAYRRYSRRAGVCLYPP